MLLRKLLIVSIVVMMGFYSCSPSSSKAPASQGADLILKNARVIPMTDPKLTYQAISIKDGKILRLGTDKVVLQDSVSTTNVVDCKGNFIFPGFIDAHAHVGQYAAAMYNAARLYGKPYGPVNTIDALLDTMKVYTNRLYPNPNDTSAVLGNGYDDAIITPHVHPTKEQLDNISGKHPMYVVHSSGHMGVANTALLNILGFNSKNATIKGGTIVQGKNGPTGLLTENANIAAVSYMGKALNISFDSAMSNLLKAEKVWFAYGITTLCEGRADPGTINLIKYASANNKLTGDFIVLPDYDQNKFQLDSFYQYYGHYDKPYHHFKIGAIKFTFDGSPQGRSAALSQPYLYPPVGEKKGFKGNLIYPDSAGYFLSTVFKRGMQVHIHVNGDTAIGQALFLLDSLKNQIPKGAINVLVHVQTCRKDQVAKLAAAKNYVRPSWFPTHTYIWGRWHIDTTLGYTRAQDISPIKWGMDMGIDSFTIHTDAPVTEPDLLTAVYSAVNRKTLFQPTTVLDPDQRIDAYNAMKAITVNGAAQWGELATGKGTIVPNGVADLVVLNMNPIEIHPTIIKDTKILRTYKDGKLVYRNPIDPIKK
ncbi:amidohydrolase [Chitinophaga silvatica]|uniref:Amidohydrolase n=1 Tax=Chitinophaga silvatica TaxID=2282649 RepID=A0A3E1Y623_9BACT|nr:amidohydrolase [Chitinophaga silvatica]RFS19997.1 amidohydrolase [Chitinophaga silvatica]